MTINGYVAIGILGFPGVLLHNASRDGLLSICAPLTAIVYYSCTDTDTHHIAEEGNAMI